MSEVWTELNAEGKIVKINRERIKENMKGSECFVRRISDFKCSVLYHSTQTKVQSVFLGSQRQRPKSGEKVSCF